MLRGIKLFALAMASAIGLSVVAPLTAEAGSKGKRNTAIGLGAVAVYGVVKKKPAVAAIAGGGAIYSYMRSRQDAKKEAARRRAAALRRARSRRTTSYRTRRTYRRTVRR